LKFFIYLFFYTLLGQICLFCRHWNRSSSCFWPMIWAHPHTNITQTMHIWG